MLTSLMCLQGFAQVSSVTVSIPSAPHTYPCSLSLRSPAFFLFFADPSFCLTSCSLSPHSPPSQSPVPLSRPFQGQDMLQPQVFLPPTGSSPSLRKRFNKGLHTPLQDLVCQPLRAKVTSVLLLAATREATLCGGPNQSRENQGGWVLFL